MAGNLKLVVFMVGTCLCASAQVLGAQVALFPGVANLAGQNNTAWRSEVFLHNASDTTQTVLLEIMPRDGDSVVASKSYTLSAAQDLRLADLYTALQAPSGAGTLRVTGDVITWVRTYNQGAQGTFGQNVPGAAESGFEVDETASFPIHTPANLQTEFRSNLILLSLDTFAQTVHVKVGGRERTLELQPGVYTQLGNVGSWVGASAGDATVEVVSNGRWAGYVSSVDPVTGDPTTVMGSSRFDYFFYDPFDSFSGWTYTPASSSGSSFRASGGLLSVASFGSGGDWPGPAATKALTYPVDTGLQDFSLDTMLNATVGGFGAPYSATVLLVDADGVPFVGFCWNGSDGRFELFAEGTATPAGSLYTATSFMGKVSVRKAGATYSLHYNDAAALATLPQTMNKVAYSVRVVMQRYAYTSSSGDMKIDWIRLGRR